MANKAQKSNEQKESIIEKDIVKESVKTEESTENKPKRRGRPPKAKTVADIVNNEKPEEKKESDKMTSETKDDSLSTPVEQPKKKRGRPPKKKEPEVVATETEVIKESTKNNDLDTSKELVEANENKPTNETEIINESEADPSIGNESATETAPTSSKKKNQKVKKNSHKTEIESQNTENVKSEVKESENSEESVSKEDTKEEKDNAHKARMIVKYILLGLGILLLIFIGVFVSYALNELLWTVILLLLISAGIGVLSMFTLKEVKNDISESKSNEQV